MTYSNGEFREKGRESLFHQCILYKGIFNKLSCFSIGNDCHWFSKKLIMNCCNSRHER